MGISGIKVSDGMSGRQGAIRSADYARKNIEEEISNLQRQKQRLSSKKEMSAEEKEENALTEVLAGGEPQNIITVK